MPTPTATSNAPHPFLSGTPAMDRLTFCALADEWRRDTLFLSSMAAMEEHPAFRRIVASGPTVVPFILEDLEENGSLWFGALDRLTGGAVSIPRPMAGKVRAMKQRWVAWGYAQGLLTHDREPPPFI